MLKYVLAFLLFISFLSVSVCLAAETTPTTTQPDVRLDQKVTYQAKGELLHKVLEDLTKKTGILLSCGQNKSDWQVRDRKVTIMVKDMPFKELQKNLAELLSFTWGRNVNKKTSEVSYRIFQDLKSKNAEAALRDKDAADEAKKELEKRESILADIDSLDSLTPEQIEKLKKDAPLLYFLAKEPLGKSMAQLLRTTPDLKTAITNGSELSVPMSQVSPETLQAAKMFVTGIDNLASRFSGSSSSMYSGVIDNIQNGKLKILNGADLMGSGPELGSMVGMLEISVPDQSKVVMPIFDVRSPMANMMGRMLLKLDMGVPIDQIGSGAKDEFDSAVAEKAKSENPVEPLPDDDDLQKVVKLGISQAVVLPDVLEKIAEKSGLQIISDNFVHRPIALTKTNDKLSVILQDTASLYGKSVSKKGGLVIFKDRKWYLKRSWEVSEDLLESWREKMKSGEFDFDDLVAAACLTDDQIKNTLGPDKDLGTILWYTMNNRYVLRFYAILDNDQKQALSDKAGLSPAMLSPEQMPYFDYITSKIDSDDNNSNASLVMTLETDKDTKVRTFKLLVHAGELAKGESDKAVQTWAVRLPPKVTVPQSAPTPQKEEKSSKVN
jgi:hypothetical protein